MNASYVGGATGVFASGLIWMITGFIGITISNTASMLALFIGGALIFPLSVFFSMLMSASGRHSTENALKHLALETLPVLFGGLLIAFYVAEYRVELFFPIMLLTIGARYFAFQTLYAHKEYWILGALLMVAGTLCAIADAPFIVGAFAGGVLEIVFSIVLLRRSKAVLPTAF
jgi:hypothetical protein